MRDKKIDFIKSELFNSLNEITPETKRNWGKMSPQHMVEHLADFFNVSAGKLKFELVTPGEQLPKYRDFLLSEKQFRENTQAPPSIVSTEPGPLRKESIAAAIEHLKESVNDFFEYYGGEDVEATVHPVFGPLNFDEWVKLHFKHVTHHLRQFGLKSYN